MSALLSQNSEDPQESEILSADNVSELADQLSDMASHWELFVGMLNVPRSTLQEIKLERDKQPGFAKICLRDGLHAWVKTDPAPTIRKVIAALISSTINNKRLADVIGNKWGIQDNATLPVEDSYPDYPDTPEKTASVELDIDDHQSVRDIVNSEEKRFKEIQESNCPCPGCCAYIEYHKKLLKWLEKQGLNPEEHIDPAADSKVCKDEDIEMEEAESLERPQKKAKKNIIQCCMCPAQLCEGGGFTTHLSKHLEGKTCERPGPVHTPDQHATLRRVFEYIECTKEVGTPRPTRKVEKFDFVRIDGNEVYGRCGHDPEKLLGRLAKERQRTASWSVESRNRQLHSWAPHK